MALRDQQSGAGATVSEDVHNEAAKNGPRRNVKKRLTERKHVAAAGFGCFYA